MLCILAGIYKLISKTVPIIDFYDIDDVLYWFKYNFYFIFICVGKIHLCSTKASSGVASMYARTHVRTTWPSLIFFFKLHSRKLSVILTFYRNQYIYLNTVKDGRQTYIVSYYRAYACICFPAVVNIADTKNRRLTLKLKLLIYCVILPDVPMSK